MGISLIFFLFYEGKCFNCESYDLFTILQEHSSKSKKGLETVFERGDRRREREIRVNG